ncbi:MAG: hypothetical protein AAFR93_08050 [Pseudomonadota bacterium]
MKQFFGLAALIGLIGSGALAQDFSANSQAREWGLLGEQKALFSAKVVDLVCEITGECAEDCGAGTHQLALLREADGVLVPVLKNRQTSFNGGAEDLLPYCNQQVEVDGTLVGDPDFGWIGAQGYLLQFIRPVGTEEWLKTNTWTKAWAAAHPDAAGKGPWFRRDPRVLKQLAATGHFGLGLDEDQKFIEENE